MPRSTQQNNAKGMACAERDSGSKVLLLAAEDSPGSFFRNRPDKMQNRASLSTSAPAAAVIRLGQLSVRFSNNADERLISGILRAVSYVF